MANLGTLMFGADIDLKKLKDSINSAKGDIEKALRITLDTNSYEEVVSRLKKLEEASQKAGKESSEAHQKSAQNAKQEADNTEKVTHLTENYRKLLADVANQMANISRIQLDGTKLGINPTVLSKVSAEYEKLWKTITNSMFGTEIFKGFPVLDMSSDQFAKLRAEFNALQSEYKLVTKSANEFNKATEKSDNKAYQAAAKNMREAENEASKLTVTISNLEALASKGEALGVDTSKLRSVISELKNYKQTMDNIAHTNSQNTRALTISEPFLQMKRDVKDAATAVKRDMKEAMKPDTEAANALKEYASILRQITSLTKTESKASALGIDTSTLRNQIALLERYAQSLEIIARNGGWGLSAFKSTDYLNARNAPIGEQARLLSEVAKKKKDNALASAQLSHAEEQMAAAIKGSTSAMHSQSQLLNDLKSLAMQYLGVWGAQNFMHNIIEIGGQLERQRLSMGAILGDAQKANVLFGQIKDLAIKSPFGVVELDQYSKQLAAYGFQYHELYDMTKRLADISAGAGTDISRIALALGHVRSEGALSGYTLRQFAMNNIPMLKKLSEYLSEIEGKLVTTAEIRKRVSKKQIGYDDVIAVIKQLTDEGGMFYNMQEVISESVSAKFKNLKDSMDIMYGEMAESKLGDSLKEVAAILTQLTRHWKVLFYTIGSGMLIFGAWKAMVIASNYGLRQNIKHITMSGMAMKNLTAEQVKNMATSGALSRSDLMLAVATKKLRVEQAELAAAHYGVSTAQLQQMRSTTALAGASRGLLGMFGKMFSPQMLLFAAAEIGVGMWSYYREWVDKIDNKTKEMVDLQKSRIKDLEDAQKNYSEHRPTNELGYRNAIEDMQKVLANSNAYTKTIDDQLTKTSKLSEKYDILAGAIQNAADKQKAMLDWEETLGEAIKESSWGFLGDNERFNNLQNIPWLNNDISKNIGDVNDSYASLRKIIDGAWEYKDALKAVIDQMIKSENVSESFRAQLEGAPFEEQIRLLAESDYWGEVISKVNETNSGFEDAAARIRNASHEVTDDWDEIASDDIPKIFQSIAEQRGIEEKEFREWCVDNPEEFNTMMDALLDRLDVDAPKIRQKIKGMFYDFARIGDLEKGIAEGALLGSSIFSSTNINKLFPVEEKADVNPEKNPSGANDKALKAAEKAAKARTKMAEAQLKIDEELAKQRLELEDAIADAEVAAIENNAERERAQRELEFEKQKRQLDKQVEEWKKKSFELAKKEYEANPKNKTVSFYDTPVGKAGWRGQSLTSEQEGIYAANLKKINAERKRQIEKDDRDLINAHASYTDRKIEIDRKYNEETEKLAVARREAEKRGDTQTIEAMNRAMAEAAKNRAKEQAKLSLDQLKEMPDYVRAFEDLENTSSETLDFLIKKFEEVKQTQAQTLTPTELKEYVDTIQKMTDEIAKRNPFKAIALANEDVAKATDEVTKAERRLAAVKRGMAPVVKIEKSANGQLNAVLLTQAEAEEQLRQAKDKQAKATKTREEVLEKLRAAMANFASTLKDLGSAIGGTAGEVIGFIADTVTFVNTASEAMKVASSKATGAMAVIEKGSAIITIIAAVINLLKELNELLPDASSKYQDYADKVSEINKATQAMEAYKIAVMEARMEEEHWFDNSSLGKLPELYNIGRQALDNYNEALMRSQAIYQNAQSGGWLTSFAHWTNPATWFKELFGWDSEWLDALAIFGSGGFGAEAMMGQLGIWLTEHANDDKYKYAEGMIAAIANLRIQTREKSSGFLGTGIGGHAEETEDLIKWVKENLKMDLFDEDFMLNEEAYKAIMDRYSDKLVGETQATLEELHDLKEKWDEYIDNLHEYVRDAYLPLQENYISALWDWYDEGKDVMDGFKDYAKSTFRDIITNMLATILNERYFKQFGETINGLYDQWAKGTLSEEDLMTGVASATSGLVTTLKDSTPVMQKIMTTVTSGFEKAGMSLQNVSNSTEDAESAFKDLRSSFLDTLMDMEGDAKDFRKKMEEIMVKDLIEKNVFSKAFTIGDEAYKNLDEYITKWNERYAAAVAKNDTVLIDQLLDELVKVRELTIKEAEALRERLKDIAEEEDDTTFSGLSDSWVSTLMDMSKTAEDWAEDIGKTMAEKIIKEMVVPTMLQPLLDDLQSVFDTTLANATTTDADGNKTYDWDQVIQSPELFEEIERLTRAYPKAQEIIKKIMDAFGLDTSYYKHEGFSNLADSIIDSLKSVDGSVENWSKEQGKKMAEQMAQAYVDEIYGSKISELNEAWQNALDKGDDNAMKAIERDLETLYKKMADDPRLQEFIAKFKELADNPFKDMAKEFTQSLMDMEQTTEDFGLSIARNLTEQMIDKIIGDSYQAQIDALGNQWAEALKNGDTAAIERIKQDMMTLRDQMGEAVQPLLDAIKEIDEQTDTTFKDMTDSWVSALMDMDKTAEDWAQEVGKMMAQKIITEMIAPVYIQPLLNSMQEAFNNAMAVSGATFQSVMSAMVPFIGEIKEKFEEIRPLIEEIFGGFGIVTEAVEEVEEAVDEVEYALGDLKSEFSSALMDMESTAESFSKNIKNILAKTFVEKFILGDRFDAMMEQWQQQFEGILTGSMSDDQRKKSIQKLAESMTDYEQSLVGPVMSLLESLGLTAESNQEATMNMADKITYDQADQLLGINIAQELTLEQILAELKGGAVIQTSPYKLPVSTVTNDDGDEQLTATLLSMIDLTRIGNDNILSQFTMANDHLRMIQEYQRKINNEVSTHLASIDMKLNNLSRL